MIKCYFRYIHFCVNSLFEYQAKLFIAIFAIDTLQIFIIAKY